MIDIIRYYENIVLDKSVDISLENIKDLLSKGYSIFNLYAIAVSDKGNGIMEIISSKELLKEVNHNKNYGIIAFAKGRQNIDSVMLEIVSEWVKKEKDLSFFKHYYNKRCY